MTSRGTRSASSLADRVALLFGLLAIISLPAYSQSPSPIPSCPADAVACYSGTYYKPPYSWLHISECCNPPTQACAQWSHHSYARNGLCCPLGAAACGSTNNSYPQVSSAETWCCALGEVCVNSKFEFGNGTWTEWGECQPVGQGSPQPPPSPALPDPTPSPGSVEGDPHFMGYALPGQQGPRYDFHGWAGGTFCIVSHRDVQVNAEFDNYGIQGVTFMRALGVRIGPHLTLTVRADVEVVDGRQRRVLVVQVGNLTLETITDEAAPAAHAAAREARARSGSSDGLAPEATVQRTLSWRLDTGGNGGIMATSGGSSNDNDGVTLTLSTDASQGSAVLALRTPLLSVVAMRRGPPALHLDLAVPLHDPALLHANGGLHGVLGQSLAWALAAGEGIVGSSAVGGIDKHEVGGGVSDEEAPPPPATPSVERPSGLVAGSDADYAVDGLFGTNCTFNRFGQRHGEDSDGNSGGVNGAWSRRRLLTGSVANDSRGMLEMVANAVF